MLLFRLVYKYVYRLYIYKTIKEQVTCKHRLRRLRHFLVLLIFYLTPRSIYIYYAYIILLIYYHKGTCIIYSVYNTYVCICIHMYTYTHIGLIRLIKRAPVWDPSKILIRSTREARPLPPLSSPPSSIFSFPFLQV